MSQLSSEGEGWDLRALESLRGGRRHVQVCLELVISDADVTFYYSPPLHPLLSPLPPFRFLQRRFL